MAETIARIQLLIDTTAHWQASNPILLSGEIGLEIKPNHEIAFKVGNGTTSWNLLDYAVFTPSEVEAMRDELQDQIDNIVIAASEGGDSSIEVSQARVNASGTTYETLKARLDAMDESTATEVSRLDAADSEIKSDLNDLNSEIFTDSIKTKLTNIAITIAGKWSTGADSYLIPVYPNANVYIIEQSDDIKGYYTFLKSDNREKGTVPEFCDGYSGIKKFPFTKGTLIAPSDAKYLWLSSYNGDEPSYVDIDGADVTNSIFKTTNLASNSIKAGLHFAYAASLEKHPECVNLDELKINTVYTYAKNSLSALTSKYPFPNGFTIMTFNALTHSYSGCIQVATDLLSGNTAYRTNVSIWTDWNYHSNTTFTVGNRGWTDFNTLKACTEFIANNNIKNAIVFCQSKIYDLVQEYGQSYLDSIVQTTNKGIGLHVGNNTHFIFANGAKVVFNYTGSNTAIGQYFSPFNITGSVTLENCTIECSNCRYCVHEDLPTDVDIIPDETTVKYINCFMQNNGGSIAYEAPACIGAGTNKNTVSVISGGKYSGSWIADISYHNYYGNEPSKVIIENVWMDKGVRLADMSTAQTIVDVIITGCRMPSGIVGTHTKFAVTEWNNTTN